MNKEPVGQMTWTIQERLQSQNTRIGDKRRVGVKGMEERELEENLQICTYKVMKEGRQTTRLEELMIPLLR